MISDSMADKLKEDLPVPEAFTAIAPPQPVRAAQPPLRENVKQAIRYYLADLGETQPVNLYA